MPRYLYTLMLIILCFFSKAQTNYYIDAIAGSDANAGTTLTAPWKNISKVNALTLTAGSSINLKAGSVWTSQQLKFNGSGTSVSPIVVKSYGTGPKPIIHGNGIIGQGVVYLYNQQYIEINNLEITNTPNTPNNADFFLGLYDNTLAVNPNPLGADRRGVMVVIDNFGTANHIYLKNLDVHHIKGQLGNGATSVNGAIPKRTGGIYFTVLGTLETTSKKSRFNDVLIDSCNINYCENIGIAFDNEWNIYYPGGQNSSISADRTEYANWFSRRFSNVLIKNNIIHHIGKNAMIIRCTDSTGLIEKNVCYETALGTTGNTMFTARAKGTVFQYNEGYFNRATTQTVDPGNIDGSMYDPDFGSVGVIFQYSYSHDNSEGLYWGCNTRGANNNTTGIPDPGDVGCTLRYCVSQNDLGDLVFLNYSSAGNEIYNNVFYIKSGISPNIIHENGNNNHTYNYFNNIIYNLSSSTRGADFSFGSGTGVQIRNISNNTFYGNHHATEPADPFKLITDPLFVSPGSGGTGINTLNGYKLQANSPAINSGKLVSNNGGFDYFKNVVSATSVPNRGIYQGTPISATTPIIISFSPTIAGTGNTVIVKGKNFIGSTSVKFGGTAAASFSVNNDSTISCILGSGATGKIVVVNTSGTDSSTSIFTFCTNPPAPSANGVRICSNRSATLVASGQGTIIWYNAPTGGTRLSTGNSFTTPVLSATTTYYAQDSTCSLSLTRTEVTVTVLVSTSSSTIVNRCSNQLPYLWNGTNYSTSGTYSYTTSNAAGCDSVATLVFTVNPLPVVSAGTYSTVNTSSRPVNLMGSPSGGTFSGTGVSSNTFNPSVSGAGTFTITYTYTNPSTGCSNSATTSITVVSCNFSVATSIVGNVNVCSNMGVGDSAVYSISAVDATSFTWSVSNASTMGMSPIVNGSSVKVKYATTFTTGTITLVVNGCNGTTITRTLAISKTVPGVPSNITSAGGGTAVTYICPYIGGTSTLTYVAGAPTTNAASVLSYRWTLPAGSQLVSVNAVDSSSITIKFPTTPTSLILSVIAVSSCGNSTAKTLALNATAPATPSVITGLSDVCAAIGTAVQTGNVTYSIGAVNNATSYLWVVPTGATLVSGQGTTNINVVFASSFVSGNISAQSISPCGNSTAKTLTVFKRVAATPAAIQKEFSPTLVAAVTNVCGLVSETYRIKKVTYATSYNWKMKVGSRATITHINQLGINDTAVTVTFLPGFTKDTLSVTSVTPCSVSAAKTVILNATLLPPIPTSITSSTGIYNACIGNQIIYTVVAPVPTANQVAASVYRWTKPNNTVIVSAALDSSSITLKFNTGYIGGSLTCKGQTPCGIQGNAKSQALTHTACPTGTKLSIPVTVNKIEKALILPNPNNGDFLFTLNTGVVDNQKIRISVMNTLGKQIKNIEAFNVNGSVIVNVKNLDLVNGIYIVKYTIGEISNSVKMIVQH